MKTQGEIEAAICEGVTRFEQEYMGRGPQDIHAHLLTFGLNREQARRGIMAVGVTHDIPTFLGAGAARAPGLHGSTGALGFWSIWG